MNMVLQSAQMWGCDRNEVNGAISIIETVIGLTVTIEAQKDHVFCRPIIF
jgi:hypothetical protein